MYEFLHKQIKKKFNANLLFTDKFSLVFEIETYDVNEDFYKGKDLFDLSDYPQDSIFFDPVNNKKVIGKTKDKFKGKIITEFVGLKSKMYSLIAIDGQFNKKMVKRNMKIIQSKLYRIGTYGVCKISLSCFDDKRYILDNGIIFIKLQKVNKNQ